MKKNLLLAAALLSAATMVAQQAPQRVKHVETNITEQMPQLIAVDAESAPMDARFKVAPRATTTPKAFYKRPAGAFYGVISGYDANTNYGSFYTPYVFGWPAREVTYEQNAVDLGDNGTYEWQYYVYDEAQQVSVEKTATGEKLAVNYTGWNYDSVPALTATGDNGTDTYYLRGFRTSGSGSSKVITNTYRAMYMGADDYKTFFTNTSSRVLYCSPQYRSYAANRDGSSLSGGYYYTSSTVIDTVSNIKSSWYGRNSIGVEALAQAFEKPEHSYVLNQVGIAFGVLAFNNNDPVELSVTVYNLGDVPQYENGVSARVYPEQLEVIGTGTYSLDSATFASTTSGVLPVKLMKDGVEVKPEINDAILIVLTGFNNPSIKSFTLYQSGDTYDDGFGETAYLGRLLSSGSIAYYGISNYFTSSGNPIERKTALSIYANVSHPYMMYYETEETGEYEFPAEGGDHAVYVYAQNASADWDYALEDGSEVPEWLTISLADDYNTDNEWTGYVNVKATAAPMPEGLNYREAKVKYHIHGASLTYTYTQQGEPSAVNDIKVAASQTTKVIENGQLYIVKDGIKYNTMGQIVK